MVVAELGGDPEAKAREELIPSKKTIVDVAERGLATFAQAFLAAITLGATLDLGALKIGAVAGGYSVAKYLIVKANSFLASPEPPKA